MDTATTLHKRRNEDKKPAVPEEVDSTSKPDDEDKEKYVKSKNRFLATIANVAPIVMFMLLITTPYIYYLITIEQIKVLAKVSENVKGRGQVINCSSKYMIMMKKHQGCLPPQCQRYTTDNMINTLEADTLLKVAKKALVQNGPFGGATVLNMFNGAKSVGKGFINVQELKDTYEVFTEIDFLMYKNVIEKIRHGIGQIYKIDPKRLYLAHPSYLMEIVPWKAGEKVDKYWHLKFDADNYKPFDYSVTIFLNDYKNNFQGGRIMFTNEPVKTALEPRKGRTLIFTTGPENSFYVETVSIGERYSMTISFTCNEKNAIKDVGT